MEVVDYGQHTDMQGDADFGPTVEEADSSLTVGFPGYTVVVAEIFGKTTQTTDFGPREQAKSVVCMVFSKISATTTV